MSDVLTFNQTVKASPAAVYHALTNALALREWLCDGAQTQVRVGGTIFLNWNVGFYVVGEFTALEPNSTVAYTWLGKGDTQVSQVEFTLKQQGDNTAIQLQHSEIARGAMVQFQKDWESSLENLQSVLETGLDLRVMRRLMLGVYPSPLTETEAARIGVPVTEGTHLTGIVEGLGAQAAGLQADDVIVTLAGRPVKDFPTMTTVLADYRGGDTVEVVYYRGSQKHTTKMTLSKRPTPQIPSSPSEFAEIIKSGQVELEAELDQLVAGVPEEVMMQRPEPEEWSANENLAHLIWTERYNQMWLWGAVGGDDSIPWPDNGPTHLIGTLAAYPTAEALVAELKRAHAATVAAVAGLPAAFMERRASLATLSVALNGLPVHSRQHFDQIRRAIEAVKVAG